MRETKRAWIIRFYGADQYNQVCSLIIYNEYLSQTKAIANVFLQEFGSTLSIDKYTIT